MRTNLPTFRPLNGYAATARHYVKMAKLKPKAMLRGTDAEDSDAERKLENVVMNYLKYASPSHPDRIKVHISDGRLTFLDSSVTIVLHWIKKYGTKERRI